MGRKVLIKVEVAYAQSHSAQSLVVTTVLPNATIEEAIIASGILRKYDTLAIDQLTVGIFGQVASLTTRLKSGDRVEIYRPLNIDPKEARRKRAKSVRKPSG